MAEVGREGVSRVGAENRNVRLMRRKEMQVGDFQNTLRGIEKTQK
ncbi:MULTISPECIES: hypothetical protein [unclassified Mesorhizobium]|nr:MULTISPECIES: hypothetical protein [unclassified Mesorhizobium]